MRKSVSFTSIPVIFSIALNTASTGPSPRAASRWIVPSWCHSATTADGIVPEPPLHVSVSRVHTTGPEWICASASASMSAS
jgi:hypothetical protein